MQTVAETPTFSRQADKLFSAEERKALIDYLAEHPAAGDEIPGTGGVRKLRFAAMGRGKRGGARVIYFYGGADMPIYALLAYSKSVRTDLTPAERRAVAGIATTIRRVRKEKP
ncbi:MAG: type II toxin-antitoxin system RelE/ParE family toxin [bacterium]|nr:type II toxin-antitoxin system RelE/ParE family toxin [bacterium]MDE0240648.1 type II toxin-antitoxin system RelE/ParE family toxin [bacterium]MDE0417625.1 type II toxin-antitoxin system RelE/ParE family toxin [bacterium]